MPADADMAETEGTLVLVVGPSGAGKDTLIAAARAHFAGSDGVLFCQRFITRTDKTGEDHLPVTEEQFAALAGEGGFFLAWRAHGLSYGIGAEVQQQLRSGSTVVANVSRAVIDEARSRWPRTHVIQVTASTEVLRVRLAARGRETAEAIDSRLKRAAELMLPVADWVSDVDNSADLASAAAAFNGVIAGVCAERYPASSPS